MELRCWRLLSGYIWKISSHYKDINKLFLEGKDLYYLTKLYLSELSKNLYLEARNAPVRAFSLSGGGSDNL